MGAAVVQRRMPGLLDHSWGAEQNEGHPRTASGQAASFRLPAVRARGIERTMALAQARLMVSRGARLLIDSGFARGTRRRAPDRAPFRRWSAGSSAEPGRRRPIL